MLCLASVPRHSWSATDSEAVLKELGHCVSTRKVPNEWQFVFNKIQALNNGSLGVSAACQTNILTSTFIVDAASGCNRLTVTLKMCYCP